MSTVNSQCIPSSNSIYGKYMRKSNTCSIFGLHLASDSFSLWQVHAKFCFTSGEREECAEAKVVDFSMIIRNEKTTEAYIYL